MRTRVKSIEPPPSALEEPLHIKYRPTSFAQVRGQDPVVKSLADLLQRPALPHAFLLVGDSGCGKTTLARIVSTHLGVEASNLLEVDAATNNGIDSMKDLISPLRYKGFGDSPRKVVIVDECHALTKQAWTSLLKTIEEPPEHVFFFFCTTDSGKVPENIKTRCVSYTLRSVCFEDMMDLLEYVVAQERMDPAKGVLELIASESFGSPRMALVNLAKVHACVDREEASVLLETPGDNKEVIDLCRDLVGGSLRWDALQKTLKSLPEMQAESIRIVITNYLGACLLGSKSEKQTIRLLDMAECFSKPCNPSDKLVPLLIAFGRYIYE